MSVSQQLLCEAVTPRQLFIQWKLSAWMPAARLADR